MTKKELKSAVIFGSGPNAAHIQKLAACCGVSASTVYRWRENPDLIPLGMLQRLAKIRGFKLEDLDTGRGKGYT